MVPILHPKLGQLYRCVELSHMLEKCAEIYTGDSAVVEKAMAAKVAVDAQAFDLIKQAAGFFESPLGRGLAMGTGIALPFGLGTFAAGSGLLRQAKEDAADTTADVRNKVLETALGLAGIGGGLYGLHRLTGGKPLFSSGEKKEGPPKQAALDEMPEEAFQKLATVGYIEEILSNRTFEGETRKLAEEVRALNRGYGMKLLYEVSHA